jgi:hypothetical protein
MKHASFMVFDSPGQREAVRPDTQRLDRTPRKSARAICLFPEAVGKVLHMRVAQMGDEVRRVTDGYQHRRIVRAANFDVPKPIGIGSVRLDRLNIRARDPMLPKHMGFAAKRRHFIFHVAYVQRPRAGKAGVYESIGAMPRPPIRNAGNSTASIQFVEEPVILRRKPSGHCVPRGMTLTDSRDAIIPS